MSDSDRKSRRPEARADLHQAGWISGDDEIRPWLRCREAPDFAVEDGARHTGL